jgi:hypothetical protein
LGCCLSHSTTCEYACDRVQLSLRSAISLRWPLDSHHYK